MSLSYLVYSARSALVLTLGVAIVGVLSFFALEPVVSQAASAQSGPFNITQTITGAISFTVEMPDVTMVGSINGLTGGHATGTGSAVVKTNAAGGYHMTISFTNPTAMQGNSAGGVIDNYTPTTPGTPDYNWQDNSAGGAAQFGYTVTASSSSDVASDFQDNNTDCNAGSNVTKNKCWMNASTSEFTIINRTSGPAANGATTTLKFKVSIPDSPSPSIPADTYVATATLTATTN
jgi:hypothetical protein